MIAALAEPGEIAEDWTQLALLCSPPIAGTALLVGYWRDARGTLRRHRLLWGASLLFNVLVIGTGVWFVYEGAPVFGFLAVWGAYMSTLSVFRFRGIQ
jgi:hypothetical protein